MDDAKTISSTNKDVLKVILSRFEKIKPLLS